jgi:hypothetical protein
MAFGQVAEHAHLIEHARRRRRVFNALPTLSARHGACSRRCRMADEIPVPETLQTIGEKIAALGKSIDERFVAVDKRFDAVDQRFDAVDQRFDAVDKRFDEVKAQLRTEIESVRGDVKLVAEGFATQTGILKRMDSDRERLERRVENHDGRILALERKKRIRRANR